jgi:hypothetical protein
MQTIRLTIILLLASLSALGSYRSCVPIAVAQQAASYPYGFDFNYTDARLATVANGGWAVSSNGYDIVFASDSLGANLLNWDALEVYSATTGQIATHIATTLSATSTTTVYLCVGNPAITTFQGGSPGAAWSSDLSAVYHLGNGSSVGTADSTANGNTLTSSGASAVSYGPIGGAAGFASASLTAADSASLHPANLSWSFWMKPIAAAQPEAFARPFTKAYLATAPDGAYLCYENSTTTTSYYCWVGFSDNTDAQISFTITASLWSMVTCTYNSSTGVFTVYLNGVSQGTATATASKTLYTSAVGLFLGAANGSSAFKWSGSLDEFMIWNVPLTATEVATLYNNQSATFSANPYSFYSVGAWPSSYFNLGYGTFPYFYNAQYAGTAYWPTTALAARGDTAYTTWDSSGNVYMTTNDGQGFAGSGGIPSGGCNNGASAGANVAIAILSSNLQTGTSKNCIASAGYLAQSNTGGRTDGYTWKSTVPIAINDGITTTGLYWPWDRQLDSPPFTVASEYIQFSPDSGATWCNSADCPTTNANGDAPPSTVAAEFTTNFLAIDFMQYEQGGTGVLNVDCNPTYIYAYGANSARSIFILGRVARGTNLQLASNWSFYTGAIGGNPCTSGNWSSSSSGATTLYSSSTGEAQPAIVYIGGTVGYLMSMWDTSNNIYLYTAPANTGPWSLQYFEAGASNGGPYAFPQPLLSTLTSVTGGYRIELVMTGNYSRDTDNSSTPYSPYFRLLTITNGPTAWAVQ